MCNLRSRIDWRTTGAPCTFLHKKINQIATMLASNYTARAAPASARARVVPERNPGARSLRKCAEIHSILYMFI